VGHGRCTFREVDLARALRAAKKAGADVARAEVARDRKIVLVLKKSDEAPSISERNEWDEINGTRIKLMYVNGFSNRDRKGQRVRYYFRRRGTKAIPLPGMPGSEEFMAAYSAALTSIPDQNVEIAAKRTLLPGTINALVVSYYKSDEWHALAVDTQKNTSPHH